MRKNVLICLVITATTPATLANVCRHAFVHEFSEKIGPRWPQRFGTNLRRTEDGFVFKTLTHFDPKSGHRTYAWFMQPAAYQLVDAQGYLLSSRIKGALGGYRRGSSKLYGRLDCPSAQRWINRGQYVRYRVFFLTEADAVSAGYRPCRVCWLDEKP